MKDEESQSIDRQSLRRHSARRARGHLPSSTTPGPTQRTASVRYAMSGEWWPERLTISDDAGTARFEVRNSPGFATMLSLRVAGGEEIATIRRRRGGRFQVIVAGKE